MVFLSGPPNQGRGSVLRLTAAPGSEAAESPGLAPIVDVTFPDANQYSYPTHGKSAQADMPNGHSQPLTVWLYPLYTSVNNVNTHDRVYAASPSLSLQASQSLQKTGRDCGWAMVWFLFLHIQLLL